MFFLILDLFFVDHSCEIIKFLLVLRCKKVMLEKKMLGVIGNVKYHVGVLFGLQDGPLVKPAFFTPDYIVLAKHYIIKTRSPPSPRENVFTKNGLYN